MASKPAPKQTARTQQRTPQKPAQRQAASPPKTPQKPSTALATRPSTEMSTDVKALLAQNAGKGISHAQEDNIVPLIYLLQANSKVCLRGGEKYIEGAEAGHIWLRNAQAPECFIDGETGMIFLPCYFSKCWIEWMPKRGGFVERHATRPPGAEIAEIEGDDGRMRKIWQMPNGNVVNESREYSGFVVEEDFSNPRPYTIPFSGSGHTVAKQWMTSMRDERLPDGEEAPLFANYWRLVVKLRTKNENSWYQYEITKEASVGTPEAVMTAAQLHDGFASGAKQSAGLEDIDGDAADDQPGDDQGGDNDDSI